MRSHTNYPLVAIQLYIPGWSVISWASENDLVSASQAVRLSNKVIHEIANHTLSIETVRELERIYGLQCKLNDAVLQACPIMRQFYKTVAIADLYLAVAIHEGNYAFVRKYFRTKHKEEPLNEYYAYAFALSCYMEKGNTVPDGISAYFDPQVVSEVNNDFFNGFSRLLFLDYCSRCPRHGKENCISENKIKLFVHMSGGRNEENDI